MDVKLVPRPKRPRVDCWFLDEIFRTPCHKNVSEVYASFDHYRDLFVKHFTTNFIGAKLGEINITLHGDAEIGEYSGAEVTLIVHPDQKEEKKGEERPTLYLITITMQPEDPTALLSKVYAHSTLLLVNRKTGTTEYFDPFGTGKSWNEPIMVVIKSLLEGDPEFKGLFFLPPEEICPYLGPQAITRDEYCSHWTLLYAILRLMCPETLPNVLLDYLLGQGTQYVVTLLNYFTCWMSEYAKNTGIIEVTDKLDKIWRKVDDEVYQYAYDLAVNQLDIQGALNYIKLLGVV